MTQDESTARIKALTEHAQAQFGQLIEWAVKNHMQYITIKKLEQRIAELEYAERKD